MMSSVPWLRICAILFACSSFCALHSVADGDEPLLFEKHIRPIFREFCFDCHGAGQKLESDLDLRLVRFMEKGGQSGPAITKSDPASSLLLKMIESGDMPPGEVRVPDEKIAIIKQWLLHGAPVRHAEPESIGPGIPISEEDRNYWAYRPLAAPPWPSNPKVESTASSASATASSSVAGSSVAGSSVGASPTSGIDEWLRVAMPSGLHFAPEAPRRTLINRAWFDLIGLPPSQEELSKWMSMASDDWFDAMLNDLFDSPHYGERWARHWLDVAGYADSDGYTVADSDRVWAWKYRDWVIRSLNSDKPFDQFVIEQLAGDELAGPAQGDWTAEQIELLTATGFLRTAADGTGSGDDSPEARNKVIADTIKIVGSSLLGSSFHCAQCHDHRYDPISHTDYFALRSIFEPALDWQHWRQPAGRLISLYTAADREKAAAIETAASEMARKRDAKRDEYMKQALEKELEKYAEPLKTELRQAYETPEKDRSPEQKQLLDKHPSVKITPGVLYQYLPKASEELTNLDKEISAKRAEKPREEFVRVLNEPTGHIPVARLFHRGDHQQPQQEVAPAPPRIAVPEGEQLAFAIDDPAIPTSGRRLAFARWLVSKQNPLLARVIVNRMWMHHFGRGLVNTPGEFGRLGSEPTHPELLDWLAVQFVESGWSLKKLHRLILTSSAWRQSSVTSADQLTLDPDNKFYSRKLLQRLDAEIIRDRMLAVTGRLDRSTFGPPVAIKEDDAGQVIVDGSQTRRSLYIRVRRTQPVAMLQTFDAPVMDINCEARPVSTVATQSLMLLNGEFTVEQAGHLAERAEREQQQVSDEVLEIYGLPKESIRTLARAWQLALGRWPRHDEMMAAHKFIGQQLPEIKANEKAVAKGQTPERQVLANVCQMLLNTNEFLYVD